MQLKNTSFFLIGFLRQSIAHHQGSCNLWGKIASERLVAKVPSFPICLGCDFRAVYVINKP